MKCPICDYPYATFKGCPNCKKEEGNYLIPKKATDRMEAVVGWIFIIICVLIYLLYLLGSKLQEDEEKELNRLRQIEFGKTK